MLTGRVVNFVNSTRRHGFMKTIAGDWNRLRELIYERRLGIRSGEVIGLKELGLDHEERREHYPTGLSDFRRMKKFLQPETQNEVFVDYGAGLGRAVILAAMLPFKRVIGVELSPVLAERAREHVSQCKGNYVVRISILSMPMPRRSKSRRTRPGFFQQPIRGANSCERLGKDPTLA
jgi:hypothetical protein